MTGDANNRPKVSVQKIVMIPKAWYPYFMEPKSPWGELLTFKNFLVDIPEDLKKYFDFIEAWISIACNNEDKKRGIKDESQV